MTTQSGSTTIKTGLTVLLSGLLLVSFFLPWVSWDGSKLAGYELGAGSFFQTAESKFGLANPFPKLSFSFAIFWLIPALALVTSAMAVIKKKTTPFAFIVGAFSLSLVTVYILFTNILIDLGVGQNVWSMLKPAAYLHGFAAIMLIISAFPVKTLYSKIAWLLLGPVIAWASFKAGEKYIMGETHTKTEQVKADYTLAADQLIREFLVNDTAANKKYVEKVIVVNGNATAVEVLADSTSTIRFEDSTTSYAIFSFEKTEMDRVKMIQPGHAVSVKGVCSGSIFSEILGTTSISFKRATFNTK